MNFWQDYWVLKTDIEISLAENVTLTVTARSRYWPVLLIIKSAITKLSDCKVSYSWANIFPVSVNFFYDIGLIFIQLLFNREEYVVNTCTDNR